MQASQVPLQAARTPCWAHGRASRQGRYLELTTALAASAKKEKCWTTNFPLGQRSLLNLPFSLFAVLLHPPQSSTVARACCAFLAGRGQSFLTCLTLHCVLTFSSRLWLPTQISKPFSARLFILTSRLLKPSFGCTHLHRPLFCSSIFEGSEALAPRFLTLIPHDKPLQAAWRSLQRRPSLPAPCTRQLP